MLYANRRVSSTSLLSPTAVPFRSRASVAQYLQEQAKTPAPEHDPWLHTNMQRDIDRLDALTKEINDDPLGEDLVAKPIVSSPTLPPSFHVSRHFGPIEPPTPSESAQSLAKYSPPVSTYDRHSTVVVRVAKPVWDDMGKQLDLLMKQKRDLETELANLRRGHQKLLDEDQDTDAQIGKLRYQNEANREQKAAMGRSLSHKDVEIKKQQLDIQNLNETIIELKSALAECAKIRGEAEWLRATIKDDDTAHARELGAQAAALRDTKAELERLTFELEASRIAQSHAGDHAKRAQNLADTLAKREKVNMELRQKIVEEQMKATNLEDEVERLQDKIKRENLNDLKEKLRDKSSQCDRFRTQLKGAEQQLKVTQSRLKIATNDGQLLRGAAHIVVPDPKSKLPRAVMSCIECYAKNITCDNRSSCQNCSENDIKCARWRCSIKHRTGECHMAPCVVPHDVQGWLVMAEPRPEW